MSGHCRGRFQRWYDEILARRRRRCKLQDIYSFDCTQHASLTVTDRDGGTLDLALTKTEQDLNVDAPNILSDHSLISWRLKLTHQPPVITKVK